MSIKDLLRPAREKDAERLEREIQNILGRGEDEGVIDHYSGQMIRNILQFRSTVVREVMIPRTEMVAIESDAGIEEILGLVEKHGYTRMPVYRGTVDNIIGILNVKDLLKLWSKDIREEDIVAGLGKPYYIPETKNVNLLLHELKTERHHMAIVIDEYGGTAGLVTLEDLIEEIVGEIKDAYGSEEKKIMELADGSFLVDGRTEIEEIEKFFQVDIPEGKFETLGGFILFLLRKIPAAGEKIDHGGLEMIIESADERSIKKVRVRIAAAGVRGSEPANVKGSHE